jgi:serine/threonine-protein phosphatase Stp1
MNNNVQTHEGLFLEVSTATRRGVNHIRNEDAHIVDAECGLFAIADGMGGHRDAHVASNALASSLAQTLLEGVTLKGKIELTTQAIKRVNEALFNDSMSDPDRDICGSTIVALLADEGHACCLWAGDSRLYLFRDVHLYLISEDHAAGDGALTRAVGSSPDLVLDSRLIEIRPGDTFLLCSDGLSKGVEEKDIADMLAGSDGGLVDRLVEKAVAGGSMDDITLVVVRIGCHGQ